MLRLLEHVGGWARLLIASLAKRTGSREFAPVPAQAIEPLPAHVIVDVFDTTALSRQREVAALPLRPVDVGGGEVERGEGPRSREEVHAAVAAIVSERGSDCIVDRPVRIVQYRKREHGRRHRRVAVVVRDERAESRHPHLAWKGVTDEFDLGDRKSSDEERVVEMRNACHRVAIGAESVSVELAPAGRSDRQTLVGAIEDAGVDQLAVALGLDGKMAVAVVLVDCRPIADAPVDEPTAARQRNAAGADATERERYVLSAGASVDEPVVDCREWV